MKRLKSWLQSDRLWWFDVVYPIALAAIFFTSLTYIVYSGKRQMRLSLHGETKLLQSSLVMRRPYQVINPKSLVVTARPTELQSLPSAGGLYPDAHADVYAEVIGKLADSGVKRIYVAFNPDHQRDVGNYRKLREVLTKIESANVTFAIPSGTKLPVEIEKSVRVVDDFPCDYHSQLQSECSYMREWDFSIMQVILNDMGEKPHRAEWISTQFANGAPSYILNLPHPTSIPQISFSGFIDGKYSMRGYDNAFVGADFTNAVSSIPDGSLPRHVITAFDAPKTDVHVSGTPLHLFWAQISQMYQENRMVVVPGETISTIIATLFCILIITVMIFYGAAAALGMFLVYLGSGAYVNSLAILHLGLYLPLIDSYYFGLVTFIVAGFGQLSLNAFRSWRSSEKHKMHSYTAELKGNFISLLSHNLNTPVAKMQGMLTLLANQPAHPDWQSDIQKALSEVAKLELAIRSVLLASAIEEGSIKEGALRWPALMDEFSHQWLPTLERLGISLDIGTPKVESDDLLYLPVRIDERIATLSIAAAAALFVKDESSVDLQLSSDLREAQRDRMRVTVSIISEDRWLAPNVQAQLTNDIHLPVRSYIGQSFFSDVLSGLLSQVVRTYQGSITTVPKGCGGQLRFSLVL